MSDSHKVGTAKDGDGQGSAAESNPGRRKPTVDELYEIWMGVFRERTSREVLAQHCADVSNSKGYTH